MSLSPSDRNVIKSILPEIKSYDPHSRRIFFKEEEFASTTVNGFVESYLPPLVSDNPTLSRLWVMNPKEVSDIAKGFLHSKIKEFREKEVLVSEDSPERVRYSEELQECYILANKSDAKEVILVNKETLIKTDDDIEHFQSVTGAKRDDMLNLYKYYYFEFNPLEKGKIFERNGTEYYNRYTHPRWIDNEILNPVLPDFFVRFMEHLFPCPKEREFTYNWIYHFLTTKAETYLLLNGAKGVGKNAFSTILSNLAGEDNYDMGSHATLERFNAGLAKSRLFIFDELVFGESKEASLKQYLNNVVSIEGKGIDSGKKTLYCSIVIMNNGPKDNYIPFDSRRYSCMQLASIPLCPKFDKDEVVQFMNSINEKKPTFDIDVLSNIGHWILQNGNVGYSPAEYYDGPKKNELVRNMLPMWSRDLISRCREEIKRSTKKGYSFNRDVFKISRMADAFEEKKKNKFIYPDYFRVISFLDKYTDKDGNKIASYEVTFDDDEDYYVIPNFPNPEEALGTSKNNVIDMSCMKSKKTKDLEAKSEVAEDGL